MIYRLIAPDWLLSSNPSSPKTIEGRLSFKTVRKHNVTGYNCYYFPNYPSNYVSGSVRGANVDIFHYVFVDFDLKSGTYASKEEFYQALDILPTKIIDSGNGVHAYWQVSDLDAMSFLRLSRRLMRYYKTDEAVSKICQLMRVPNTVNNKDFNNRILCSEVYAQERIYSCEELDKLLPPLSIEDEVYCKQHYNTTHGITELKLVSDKMPPKFGKLLQANKEAKKLWASDLNDRSKGDYRLGVIMLAHEFTKEEAITVLANSAKASTRNNIHRLSYAENIANKIWTHDETEKANIECISTSVRDILNAAITSPTGTRFACSRILDDTEYGFRLGQVIGIIGGSGVGKTTLTLNAFLWFAHNNPEYHHFFFSLEQPAEEIAKRIQTICQGNESLFDKIHIVSNYAPDGTFLNLSIDGVEDHIKAYEQRTGFKAGAVVVDHIGVLSKSDKHGESEGLMGICKRMKSVAVSCNIMLLMLSQAPREKAGIGDLELNKDAAYGTVAFESYVDYCLCLWQPLKRVYHLGAPTTMAFKFAKIRHKKQGKDKIQEDVRYQVFFDPNTELLREMTQDEETAAKFWLNQATNDRKQDRKTDIIPYKSRRINDEDTVKTSTTDYSRQN